MTVASWQGVRPDKRRRVGYASLAEQIIIQAAKDAWKGDWHARRFLRSGWCQFLAGSLGAERVLQRVQEELSQPPQQMFDF